MSNISKKWNWPVALFMVLNPLAALVGLVLLAVMNSPVPASIWIFAGVFFVFAGIGITAGYHRMFSHRSYEAHPAVEWFLLLAGAATFQGSCLKWSSDHRRHHGEVDTDADPYSIQKGFWYAHIGWLFLEESVNLPIAKVADLQKNPRVAFQDKYYLAIAIAVGFLFPMAVGWALGNAFAGLIIAGSLRIVLNHQTTFFVNSIAHWFGKQTYSKEVSARDSLWVALLTHGEGFHNFHHTFQIDFRNGIKWYHWDPTKWVILSLKWMGLASKLRTISPAEILRARLRTEGEELLTFKAVSPETVEQMKGKILEAQAQWRKLKEEYALARRQYRQAGSAKLKEYQEAGEAKLREYREAAEAKMTEMKRDLRQAKAEFNWALAQWHMTLATVPVRRR